MIKGEKNSMYAQHNTCVCVCVRVCVCVYTLFIQHLHTMTLTHTLPTHTMDTMQGGRHDERE